MSRDILTKLSVVSRITNKEETEDLYTNEPFVFKLVLDKFKEFLVDPQFDTFERQIVLLKFLENNYPLEISREVVEFINASDLKDDYLGVILEWNYVSSEFNRQYNLAQLDALGFEIGKLPIPKLVIQPRKSLPTNDALDKLTDMLLSSLSIIDDEGEDEED